MDVICFAVGALAGCFLGRTLYYKKKWKTLQGEYDNRSEELANARRDVGREKRLNESLKLSLRRTESLYESSNKCLPKGYPSSYDYSVVRSEYRVCVFGRYKSYAGTDTTVCIKAIPIEGGDEDFAIRQAEELIEIINNF